MNNDPWMQPKLAETFNAYVQQLAVVHTRQQLVFIQDRSKLGHLWPDLDMIKK